MEINLQALARGKVQPSHPLRLSTDVVTATPQSVRSFSALCTVAASFFPPANICPRKPRPCRSRSVASAYIHSGFAVGKQYHGFLGSVGRIIETPAPCDKQCCVRKQVLRPHGSRNFQPVLTAAEIPPSPSCISFKYAAVPEFKFCKSFSPPPGVSCIPP